MSHRFLVQDLHLHSPDFLRIKKREFQLHFYCLSRRPAGLCSYAWLFEGHTEDNGLNGDDDDDDDDDDDNTNDDTNVIQYIISINCICLYFI